MRRGDLVWVDLEPVIGSEANKRRPAVVVSNDGANRVAGRLGRGVITVVPITAATDKVFEFQVLLESGTCGLTAESKAQAEQIRSVDVRRVGVAVGHLTHQQLSALDEAIRLHLGV